jgi:limonene-1,2-epoxide hydrolase
MAATREATGAEPAVRLEATVREFLDRGVAADVAGSVALLADDAEYHVNAWNEPLVGRDAIGEEFQRQRRLWSDFRYELLHVATTGNVVLTERVDTVRVDGRDVTVHIAGVFELDADAHITRWRDYFDSHEIEEQLA